MDQLACSVTEKENALFLDCKDLDYSYAPIPTDVSVAILDSGTRRKLSDGRYNTRRNECEQAALILGVRTLRSLNRDTLEKNVDALRDFQYLRALHVLDENERVNRAFLALKKGAITTVGKLMDEGHWSLRELFEVSTDNLDWLVNIARDQKGCLGARMTGAGFGGCAVALVKKDQAENFAARVPKIYLEKTGKRGSIFFTRPVDGCSLEE
ncbi:galactokinase, partial [bacterium]|nr:galactokinase [bacterium]